jgi:light-regulated signal transduction histidine kinase (bacteriophytochrome)
MADAGPTKSLDILVAARPDAIQPFGWLLIGDEMASRVQRCSVNIDLLFPGRKGALIGAAINDLLGPTTAHSLRNALSRCTDGGGPTLLQATEFAGCAASFDLAVSRSGAESLIEIEKAPAQPDLGALDRVRAMEERIAKQATLEKMLSTAARLLHSTLQYDRVSILRFGRDGAVQLLAQQPNAALPSDALGPVLTEGARSRLAAAHIRLIADRDALPTPIVGEADTTPTAEGDRNRKLTLALLRAVEPEERDALRREGFAASLSLALMVDGGLWGAILCQHPTPRLPNMSARVVAELFASFLSLRVQMFLQKEALGIKRL